MANFWVPAPSTPLTGISIFVAGSALLLLSSCSRRSAPPITSINDDPLPPSEGVPQTSFAKVAEKVRPAVVVLATFDEYGGLVANEYAFFISPNGDLLAEKAAMNNAASALAKSADGEVYEIQGTYVRSTSPDFIILKTKAQNVPYLNVGAAAAVPDGARVGIVLNANTQPSLMEGKISGRKADGAGEWLTFAPELPKTTAGAPAIDEHGALVGVVAQRGDKAAPAIFHASAGTNAVVAQIAPIPAPEASPEDSLVESAPPEMVASATPEVQRAATPTKPRPSPPPSQTAEIDMNRLQPEQPVSPDKTPEGFFLRMNPNWHIHEKDRPHSVRGASSRTAGGARSGRLVHTPAPRNPGKKMTNSSEGGTGSYRLTFNDQGKVTDVQVVRSAGWSSLDSAAITTLRSWRAEAGRGWSVVVPVTFK